MKNAEIKALQVKKELMLKANVASEAAESLQMANNISANLDSNSQDSGSSPNSAEAGKLSQNYIVSSKECPLPLIVLEYQHFSNFITSYSDHLYPYEHKAITFY